MYQLDFSIFSEVYRCCPQQWGLATRLCRPILTTTWFVQEFPWNPLWSKTQLDVTLSWYWKLCLVRDSQFGFCLPHYLMILLRSALYMSILQEASTISDIQAVPKMALRFSCLSQCSLCHHSGSPSSPPDPLTPSPTCPYLHKRFPPPRVIHLSSLVLYSIPILCGSKDCSLVIIGLVSIIHVQTNIPYLWLCFQVA